MSSPSNTIRPAVGSNILRMARPVVDLPQPDSPTSPKVPPRLSAKLMPSTACTVATRRWMMVPLVKGKCTLRSSTRTTSSPPPAARALAGEASGAGIVEAGLPMLGRKLGERWAGRAAGFASEAAARREGTARRQLRQIGRLALDGHQAAPDLAVKAGDGRHQAQGVGMAGLFVEDARGGGFDDAASVHDGNAVGIARHHAQIVGNQQ